MKTALNLVDWIDYALMEGNSRQRPALQCCHGHISAARGVGRHNSDAGSVKRKLVRTAFCMSRSLVSIFFLIRVFLLRLSLLLSLLSTGFVFAL